MNQGLAKRWISQVATDTDTCQKTTQELAKRWISQLARIRIRKMVREMDQTQARKRLRVWPRAGSVSWPRYGSGSWSG